MLHKIFKSSFWTQVFVVTLFIFAIHVLLQGLGLNIVMRYYLLAGNYFMEGTDPYIVTVQYGSANSFKYSPLFVLLFGGMARLFNSAPILLLGLWVLAGNFLFACGLRRWCDLSVSAPFYFIIAIAAALLDTVLSTGAYQINTIVIGIMLLGLAEYRDERYFSAGALLMLAANLKIYPVIFLAALLFRFKWKYWLGALAGGFVVFILPALWVGWTFNFNAHLSWVRAVLNVTGDERILDITAAFERAGLATFGLILHKVVFVVSLVIFYAYAIVSKRMDWRPWLTFGIAAMLLISPRSEIYTYVMLAPAYLSLFYWCRESAVDFIKKYGAIIVTLLAAACASCRFTNPRWYHSQEPWEIVRVLCSLGFWIFTGTVLAFSLYGILKEKRAAARQRNSAA